MTCSQEQINIMIQFMEDHPELNDKLPIFTAQTRNEINNLWENLTNKLNAVGPQTKSVGGWRRGWTQLKYRIKRKFNNSVSLCQKTEDASSEAAALSDIEKRVLILSSLDSSFKNNENITGNDTSSCNAEENDCVIKQEVLDFEDYNITNQLLDIQLPSENDFVTLSSLKRKHNSIDENPVSPKRLNNRNSCEPSLKEGPSMEPTFHETIINLLKERNEEDARFHKRVIELLEEKNSLYKEKHFSDKL